MRRTRPAVESAALASLRLMVRQAVGRVSRRAQAILWWLDGETQAVIAQRLGVSRQTVNAWCRRFGTDGAAGLADRPRSGRPPRLDEAGRQQVRTLLGTSDLPGTTGPGGWTTTRLVVRLGAAGWAVSRRTVRRWLRRLRARWRRGRLAAKGDPERATALARLAAAVLAAHLAAQAAGRRLVIVFEDEADLALLAHAGYSWQLVDQPAAIPTPGTNQKLGLFGSLSLDGDVLVTEAARKTAVAFTAHLDTLVAPLADAEVLVILDNVRIHYAKLTAAWFTAHPQVHPAYLPRYSPNDNAQERVWGWLREAICRNRAFADLATKIQAARDFFAGLTAEALRQRCVPDRLLIHLLAEALG